MTKLRIASAQLNPTVGDISANLDKARAARAEAAANGADLIVFPEVFILGYPPEDLVLKPAAVEACHAAIQAFAKEPGIAALIGTPWREDGRLYNAVVLIDGGEIKATRYKHDLPNYAVFDEKRVFAPAPLPAPVEWRGMNLGLPICEDIWLENAPRALAEQGADVFISINGSPWRRTIEAERREAFRQWADLNVPLVFVNQVGGQDELVFDGASFAWNADGKEFQRLPAFTEHLAYSDWTKADGVWTGTSGQKSKVLTGLEADWKAACLALADYVNKNGFPGVVLGMSGGIDSAISAAIAADALGPDRVWAVMMPSKYTSDESLEDAKACAEALGVRYDIIDVEPAIAATGGILTDIFAGQKPDTTEENIQSRMRGVVLMALSNKFGPVVLSTGNKSEMAVGYATLYGDMNGGYNALKDIYKSEVYQLARWRNQQNASPGLAPAGTVIPERIITKAPSAELKPDQTDQDSLPDYDVLDEILTGLVENEHGPKEIAAQGHDPALIARIENMLYRAEYKRRQAPPGAKIGRKNFGRDRRYPITNKFRSVK
ncbi:MAG: NAD+ synthase [Alphaproteobacteria bacterium]|nr:NAD+ synthase [Alphaproteobacteria bacterium]